MRAAAVVAGVLAQFQEFFDVQVPRFQVRADRALALAALVHRHGGVVDDLQERDDALAFAVGALDVAAQRAHRGPVVAQAAGVLGQQRVFLDGVVDAFQVIRHGGQVARRQLRVQRARVEQRRRRAHEVERGQDLVELDGARFAVGLAQRQAHGHAHEEHLRQFDAGAADVQEVAVVQGLQAQVAELQVALGVQGLAQAGQVIVGQFGRQQAAFDTASDERGEVLGVARDHAVLRDFFAQHFLADRVQQQAGGDLAVGRVFFNQRARRQDGGLEHFVDGDAVVQVLDRFLQDGFAVDEFGQAFAGGDDGRAQFSQVQRTAHAGVGHVQHVFHGRGGGLFLAFGGSGGGALLRALLAVQDVGAGNIMLARAHQRQFDLVLDVFNMEGAAIGAVANQGADGLAGQRFDQFADARGRGALSTVDGQEGLGHGDGDLAGFKPNHRAIAANDVVAGPLPAIGVGRGIGL
ncbi:hypothetical protein D3C72_1020390 [compost metagenome]